MTIKCCYNIKESPYDGDCNEKRKFKVIVIEWSMLFTIMLKVILTIDSILHQSTLVHTTT